MEDLDRPLPEQSPEEEAPWLPRHARELPGWPGYRTRPGRSGYDPLDTEFEWAHMQGLFLRALVTGRLRTRNPAYLALMLIVGFAAIAPSALALIAVDSPPGFGLALAFTMSPFAFFGIALLVNAIRSM